MEMKEKRRKMYRSRDCVCKNYYTVKKIIPHFFPIISIFNTEKPKIAKKSLKKSLKIH